MIMTSQFCVTPPTIHLSIHRVAYQQKTLFENFEITLPAQQWTCFLGPSGVGKSTLLHLIAGLDIRADEKTFSIKLETSDSKPLKHRIAYMGQQDLLLPWLSVIDNVALAFRLQKILTPNIQKKALETLEHMHLAHIAHQMPHTLSGGMRQRVALARTWLCDQPVVLMDEPFSALDAMTRWHLQQLASEWLSDRSVIFVTHDPIEAIRLAHRIDVFSGSPAKIIATFKPEGDIPRDITDPKIFAFQNKLLVELKKAYEGFL